MGGRGRREEGGRVTKEFYAHTCTCIHVHAYMHVCHLFQSQHVYMQLEVVYFLHYVLESYM